MASASVPLGVHRIGERVTAGVATALAPGGRGHVRCWRYDTAGLAGTGGRELACLVRAGDGEARAPAEPLAMLAAVARLVVSGQRVGVGDLTVFGSASGPPLALCYAQAPAWLDGDSERLLAVALLGAEVGLAQSVGATRVLARLGAAASVYPFPAWSHFGRDPVAVAGESSLLDRLSRMRVDGAVELRGMTIWLAIDHRSREPVRRELATLDADAPVALLTGLPSTAAAQLIWHPGQRGPRALHASAGTTRPADGPSHELGDRVGGAFAAFVPASDRDAGALVEDGFCARLTDATWATVREALVTGQPRDVAPGDPTDYGFALRWH